MIIIRKHEELCGNIISAIDANDTITDFTGDDNKTAFCKVKKISSKLDNRRTKDVKIMKWYH